MSSRLARTAGLISAATMLSRLFGLVREQLFAALLGASLLADAFIVAFRIPNLLRDLFAEGALSQAFIPTFQRERTHRGDDAAFDLGNRVAGTLLVIVGSLVLLGALFATPICDFLGQNFDENPGQLELAATLTRIMLPFLPVISLAAVAMGMLNAHHRFTAPALAPAMFNIACIAVGSGIYLAGVEGEWVVIAWSIGTLLGGLCQLGIQLPSLWKLGYRPRLRVDLAFRHPQLRKIRALMLPAIGGLAAVQINIIVNTLFATTQDGAATCLNYAFRFLQLPIGVFGVAIATVSTTRYGDAASRADPEAAARHLAEGLRLTFFLTVPATVGLVLLAEPIVRLIYFRGAFDLKALVWTTDALKLYAVGLTAYSAVKVIAPAFYAFDSARIPMLASMAAVAINLALNISLHPRYGFRVLALGTAVAALVNVITLYACFQRRIAAPSHARLLGYFVRIALAAAVMGAAVWGLGDWLAAHTTGDGLGRRALLALGPVGAGALVYVLACVVLRIEELRHYTERLAKRR